MNSTRRKPIHIIVIAMLLTSLFATTFFVTKADAKAKMDAQAFHDAMRKLWEDHITWTRMVIVDFLADPNGTLPDTQASVDRLLQNQVDIGNAIKPFYGDEAGNHLTDLLTQHILIAAEILQDAKAGDTAALNDAAARWYANADEIAAFLNSLNPEFWPLDQMQEMMRMHLDLTLQEAVTYLHGDYAGSVAAYEQVHLEILEMADMLSTGIIEQFPTKFK
ncbi:MAG TPA: hypothetical protein VK909_07495 [Anaerolineales bacterium]|nr:hypothetical protein [Anaerolineales bacterium]